MVRSALYSKHGLQTCERERSDNSWFSGISAGGDVVL